MSKPREFWICKEDPWGKVRVEEQNLGGTYMIHVREVDKENDALEEARKICLTGAQFGIEECIKWLKKYG